VTRASPAPNPTQHAAGGQVMDTDEPTSSSRANGEGQRAENGRKAHWQVRFNKEIRAEQDRHALAIKAIADKAGVKLDRVRRAVDRIPTRHKSKLNDWNGYQAWLRHRKVAARGSAASAPEPESAHNTEGDSDVDADEEPVEVPVPRAGQSTAQAYKGLTDDEKQALQTWTREQDETAEDVSELTVFNRACRDMTTRIADLELRHHVTAVAILSHADEGIPAFVAYTSKSKRVLDSVVHSMKSGRLGIDLTVMFERATKLKVWELGNIIALGEKDASAAPEKQLSAVEAAKTALMERISKTVSQNLVNKAEAIRAEWSTQTKDGMRMRFKDFFTLTSRVGCFIEGWPEGKAAELLRPDVMKTFVEDSSGGRKMRIWSGSLYDTAKWSDERITDLCCAIEDGTLQACATVEGSGGNRDEEDDNAGSNGGQQSDTEELSWTEV